jgi:hypothetical protein
MAAGAAVLMLLGARGAMATPLCRRRFWRPARATLRALTGHAVFAAMAEAAGPLGRVASHRRLGCADEFWFPAASAGPGRAVVFPGPAAADRRHAGRPRGAARHPGDH